jgi:hypothetical protein
MAYRGYLVLVLAGLAFAGQNYRVSYESVVPPTDDLPYGEQFSVHLSLDRHVYRLNETVLVTGNVVAFYNHTAVPEEYEDVTL